jgi:hypothetical protein
MSVTVTVGVMAIAIDGGYVMDLKRQSQAVADAAALAGAIDLYKNFGTYQGLDTNGTADSAARATVVNNGFTGSNVTVIVNTSPTNYSGGPHQGTPIPPGYIEVIVQNTQQPFFSGVLGATQLSVGARAVARGVGATNAGSVFVLSPSTWKTTLSAAGNGNLTLTAAALVVNSGNSTDGVDVSSATVSVPTIALSATPGYTTSNGGRLFGTVATGQQAAPDPLAYLADPNPTTLGLDLPSNAAQPSSYSNTDALTLQGGSWPSGLQLTGSGPVTLNPGMYTGGISVTGGGDVTFNPGIYYIDGGGLNLSGQGNVTANNVMFYVLPYTNTDGVTIAGQGTTTITPMTKTDNPTYAGISFFQQRLTRAPMNITTNGQTSIDGTVYAAKATINLTANGGTTNLGSELISNHLNVTGNGLINISSLGTAPPPRRLIGLVE